MSAVLGIDLSSRCLDLVKLNEDDDRADWARCPLEGKTAWERTLTIPDALPKSSWLDDIYLVALEAPYGHGSDLLNRVVGAIAAALPTKLRTPERLWIVRPDEWKRGHGIKTRDKPSFDDLYRIAPDGCINAPDGIQSADWQHGIDAYCLAHWARGINAQAIEAA